MSSKLLAGRYELIEKIGEGGMAIVYKGKDRLLNRYVAIKILRPEYTKDDLFIDSFRKESQAAAGLSHPNIVGVYDVGKEGNIYFIVMELIEGKVLSDIIKEKGRLDYKEAINIIHQVASALSLAHKNQIIHRDVKPHNILITNTGVAKLADFGIAKAISAATIVDKNTKIMGSVHYFSPEQARGTYIDERSDIYSLGIVLYELLTGKVPFDGENAVAIALMHINEPMPSLSESVQGIPPQLERIVSKATEKYQTNRYKTVDEMIEDLDNIEFISKVMGEKAFLGINSSQGVIVDASNNRLNMETTQNDQTEEITEKQKEKNMNKKVNILIISLGILVLIAGIIGLGFVFDWFGGANKEIEVPSFVGKTFEQAQIEAEKYKLVIERGDDVYSPDQEEGNITSQSPIQGALVTEGKVITVNVSKGKKDGVVPKIEGMDFEKAKEYVKQFGFTISMAVRENNTLPKDTIISQSIPFGTKVAKGTEIEVTISDGKGKEIVKMPSLIGKSPNEANSLLTEAGLSVGEVKYEETTEISSNLVFWQEYPEGTELEKNKKVSYKISKGEEVVPGPDIDVDGDDIGAGETADE